MASPHLTEIFDDVKLVVELCMFRDPRKFTEELQRTSRIEKATDSYLVVRGPFEHIEGIYVKSMSTMERNTKTNTERETRNNLNHHTSPELTPARSTRVEPVEIHGAVIQYIKEKHAAEFEQIQRTGVDVQIDKRRVVFRPLNTESRILDRLARERFVTFYQKIATALQTRTLYLNATQRKTLVTKFPELLHSNGPGKHEVTLTGNYFDLERFEQFLQSSPRTSSHKQTSHTDNVSGTPSSPIVLQNKSQDKEEICSICLEPLVNLRIATLDKCKHSFCKDCLKRAFDIKPVCPTCGVIYGALKGTQPKTGTMRNTVSAPHLPGYEKYRTIVIHYYFPSGMQGDEHPNPGQPYEGVSRFAYLPDSPEGRKVLQLLKQAFEQRLTFTIGRSSTTGKSNVVTWNDIHHKTSRDGGPTCYGYPDPDYLKRVQEELKVKGIY